MKAVRTLERRDSLIGAHFLWQGIVNSSSVNSSSASASGAGPKPKGQESEGAFSARCLALIGIDESLYLEVTAGGVRWCRLTVRPMNDGEGDGDVRRREGGREGRGKQSREGKLRYAWRDDDCEEMVRGVFSRPDSEASERRQPCTT